MADVLIALGGNVGDVRPNFVRAIDLICQRAPGRLLAALLVPPLLLG